MRRSLGTLNNPAVIHLTWMERASFKGCHAEVEVAQGQWKYEGCGHLGHKPARCLPPLPLSTEIHSWVGVWILHCHPGYSTFTTQAHTLVAGASLEQVSGEEEVSAYMDLDRFLQMGVPQRLKQLSCRRQAEALGNPSFRSVPCTRRLLGRKRLGCEGRSLRRPGFGWVPCHSVQ